MTRSNFQVWDSGSLPRLSTEQALLSSGFSQIDFGAWLRSLPNHWIPFFDSAGVSCGGCRWTPIADRPFGLEFEIAVEIGGYPALIAIGEETRKVLTGLVLSQRQDLAEDLLIDYLVRRFLSTLSSCWEGPFPLSAQFSADLDRASVQSVQGLVLNFSIAEKPCLIWLGIDKALVSKFDKAWKERLKKDPEGSDSTADTQVTLDLAHLDLAPEMLIDALREGSILELGLESIDRAFLSVDGKFVAGGALCEVAGCFAIQVAQTQIQVPSHRPELTEVLIRLGQIELEAFDHNQHLQEGAVLVSEARLGSPASIVIGGEVVQHGELGRIGDTWSLRVLPK